MPMPIAKRKPLKFEKQALEALKFEKQALEALKFEKQPAVPSSSKNEVHLSRNDAQGILDHLEDIAVSDGEMGFSRAEVKRAAETLRANGIISDPALVNKRNLTRFVTKFRQAIRNMPADYKKNCRTVDCNGDPAKGFVTLMVCPGTEREVCDDVVHSMEMYITEGEKGFRLVYAEYTSNT